MSAYDNPKMRDEIWIRVYAEHFHAVSPTHNPSTAARLAAQVADDAVAFLPKPMHHEAAHGFKATAFRSFKLHALHDLGPVKAGQPVLVVHMDRGMVDCIPWPEGMFRIPANELAEQPPEKHKTKVPRTKDADRWLGDTFIAAEASDPLNKLAGAELLDDDALAEMIARRLGQRRSNLDEVYEAHGERFTLPADVVAELKGAAPLLLKQTNTKTIITLHTTTNTNTQIHELEAGIRRALDHLGSAREEDSLDRREQYRAEAERELERVL